MATGFGSYAGFGKETTWGTPVARSVWMEVDSEALKVSPIWRPRGTLGNFLASRNSRKKFLERINAGGPIGVRATYEGFGILLEALMGAVATTGSGPYTHVFTLARSLPTGLTIEPVRGDGATTEVFTGCLLNKGTLRIEAGGEMRANVDVIARSSGGRVSPGTPTHTASRDLTVHYVDQGVVTFNGTTYQCRYLEITIDNKLGTRLLSGGGGYTARPAATAPQEVTIKLGLEWETDAMPAAWLAGTEAAFSVVFTSSGGKTITIESGGAYVDDVTEPLAIGVINQDVSFRCLATSSNEGLTITMVNALSTAIAP